MCLEINTRICMYTYICICMCIHIYTGLCKYTCIYRIFVDIYTHRWINIHTLQEYNRGLLSRSHRYSCGS